MNRPPVCDYEGSDYRARFWGDKGRTYEDRVERTALRRLLPLTGENLIDIGAGYGRLANEFGGYRRVVLFDYSRSLLREAQEALGRDDRFTFVAGNWYQMPFVAGLFDAMVQVRTIHHAADVPALFSELARIAGPGSDYILEFASKFNLKAILRYWAGRQAWSPFAREPVEFVELNFDFHPTWMNDQLTTAGFEKTRMLTVSHFRLAILKKLIPTQLLAGLDGALQPTGRWWQLTPSVFYLNKAPQDGLRAKTGMFFACPNCQTALGQAEGGYLHCPDAQCGRRWAVRDGLYDFKEPA